MARITYSTTTSPTVATEMAMATFLLIMKKGIIRLARNKNTERWIPTWGSQVYLHAHCRLNVIRTDTMQSAKLISNIKMTQKIGVGTGVAK